MGGLVDGVKQETEGEVLSGRGGEACGQGGKGEQSWAGQGRGGDGRVRRACSADARNTSM